MEVGLDLAVYLLAELAERPGEVDELLLLSAHLLGERIEGVHDVDSALLYD